MLNMSSSQNKDIIIIIIQAEREDDNSFPADGHLKQCKHKVVDNQTLKRTKPGVQRDEILSFHGRHSSSSSSSFVALSSSALSYFPLFL